MSTSSIPVNNPALAAADPRERVAAGLPVLLGRALYSAIFITGGLGHFSAATIAFAAQQGVPLAGIAVPFSGILALLGGASILLGYRVRLGAWLLLAFLIPVTFSMHNFWAIADPAAAYLHKVMFLKNAALAGTALLIAHFGAGPLSLDARNAAKSKGR